MKTFLLFSNNSWPKLKWTTFGLVFAVLFASILTPAFGQKDSEPVRLFDGRTLDGWDYNPEMWRVEDGAVTGGSPDKKVPRNEFISTKKNYANFDLRLKIKCSGDPSTGMINSGIQIRSVRLPGGTGMSGYQIDCGKGWFGKIYDEHRRGLVAEPIDAAALDKAVDVYGWNEYRILAEGPRIQVWINGVKATDYTEKDPDVALDGHIAPQIHSGGMCVVQFKDVSVRELPPTPGAPTWESLGGVEAALKKLKAKTKAKGGAKPKVQAAKPLKAGNTTAGEPRTAAEQLKSFHVPAGYEIELVVQESEGIGKFISVYFDQRGRMWTQTALEYPVDGNENPEAAEALYQSPGRDKILVYPRESLNGPLPEDGLSDPVVFADGLAIPLGILPWGAGDVCYVLHGHDLLRLTDTDGDGRADKREVILTGFGVQDSHLFPHQFTRAPGDWIWMAQGLFNNSAVKRPGGDEVVEFPQCSMARLRPDGSNFEITSTGPNNIWGLVITGEGEAFIQEANDFGYPVMPFHDYAYYPGGMARHKKSYQPEFPATAEFRMGGTGLSGLALVEGGPKVEPDADLTMLIANPITSTVNAVAMHRDGDDWRLEQLADFIQCDDPFFRPVAMTQGPDGCLYIVDWYNKIISHNEVPRNHPDRDKTRGRIWRVKAKKNGDDSRQTIPDFTELGTSELVAMLGERPTARAHLAVQTLIDRNDPAMIAPLKAALAHSEASDARRIQSLWILPEEDREAARPLTESPNRNVRREMARFPEFAESLVEDSDREVRFAAIQTLARQLPARGEVILPNLLALVKPTLSEPTGPSTRSSAQILVDEAYSRAFERYLIRLFLERNRETVQAFLDSEPAASVSTEGRVLAILALEPEAGASRLAALLPALDRAPNEEQVLRIAQYPDAPGCAEALAELLSSEQSAHRIAKILLEHQASLDPAKIGPILARPAEAMLKRNQDSLTIAANLIGAFRIDSLEPSLTALLEDSATANSDKIAAIRALQLLRSGASDLLARLVVNGEEDSVRDAALAALAESKAPDAASRLISLYPQLDASQRRMMISTLSAKKAGAEAIVSAFLESRLPKDALDGPAAEKLSAVLGDSPKLTQLMESMSGVFRDILVLDGSPEAWTEAGIDLAGPFTVEAWVRLAPGIGNADGILGVADRVSMNFHDSRFRVWIKEKRDVAISRRPLTPDLWTHVAVTRDAVGRVKLYSGGELDAEGNKPLTEPLQGLRVGWTPVSDGTQGAFAEFRVWDHARTPSQIRDQFDRGFTEGPRPDGLLYYNPGGDDNWGNLGQGAKVVKTIDSPPILTAKQAEELDAKFARFMKLGQQNTGDPEKGKSLATLCTACHVINGTGGQIGPDLSGAGAMGLEAVLRNLLTPNAAMEAGYRIYRVEMKNGDLLDAFYVGEDKNSVVVRQPGSPDRRVSKEDIRSTRYIRRSLMPEGLLDSLDDQMAADLLAYLMTLK